MASVRSLEHGQLCRQAAGNTRQNSQTVKATQQLMLRNTTPNWILPPLSNSWVILIIWLYIALNRTPNIDCYWVGAVPKLYNNSALKALNQSQEISFKQQSLNLGYYQLWKNALVPKPCTYLQSATPTLNLKCLGFKSLT